MFGVVSPKLLGENNTSEIIVKIQTKTNRKMFGFKSRIYKIRFLT